MNTKLIISITFLTLSQAFVGFAGNVCADGEAKSVVKSLSENLSLNLSTDKAAYQPGQTVNFTSSETLDGYTIRYRHGSITIAEQQGHGKSWTWNPPATNNMGYMVDIYKSTDNSETIYGSIAVDVSSDWVKFPRYGFVANFDSSKLADGVIEREMQFLNRCHINGVQFQDWHYKHHWPLGGTRNHLLDTYTDIANRETLTEVVQKYIAVQHSLGMKSIFYNLCFGVLNDGKEDGVSDEWMIYKDTNHSKKDALYLDPTWKSDIYIANPGNDSWINYIAERNDEVYANLDFDGYQIDQLGSRDDVYDYYGNPVNLPLGYLAFIKAMKARHPEKRLIMNAVSSFGAAQISGSGCIDFCYNETWNTEDQFQDLYNVIKANDRYSNNACRTIFAAYMNYDYADKHTGWFNTPGVLLTDAVMMALGGDHLELGGDHMLSREYFPTGPLKMTDELTAAIIRYYDFMTAYENLLRGESLDSERYVSVSCPDQYRGFSLTYWPPKQRSITTFAKEIDGKTVIHLLNFINAENLNWRDLNLTRPEPQVEKDIPVVVDIAKPVEKVWIASPDYNGGVAQFLPFTYNNEQLFVTIPSIKYWQMLVIE